MDAAPSKYAPPSEAAVLDLVERNPFAWIVSEDAGFSATPLPVLPVVTPDGALTGLTGHFGRNNPHLARLRRHPRALLLVMGRNAYVSPSWMQDRTQAPTWNYESAAFTCDIALFDEAQETESHLRELIAVHEAGRARPWSLDEMGPRYTGLARGVVGFHAAIRARRIVFKLGQDEREDVFPDILNGLEATGSAPLAHQMRALAAAGGDPATTRD